MIVSVDFDELDIFNCTYGISKEVSGGLRVFVEGGLAFPYGNLLKEKNSFRFIKCEKNRSGRVERIFPRHYIYDPSRQVEYVEWELNDDRILRARTESGEWAQYVSKADSEYALHEYVGGCWFVFENVIYSKRVVGEYTADRKGTTGEEVVQEFGSRSWIDALSKEYFLEGVLEVEPGPGWMSWSIFAKSFHIEIPDIEIPDV